MTLRESIEAFNAENLALTAAHAARMLAGVDMMEGAEGAGAAFLDAEARCLLGDQRRQLAREEMDRLWLIWAAAKVKP